MVILFPGQGSQYIGMGEELFAQHREEVETFHEVLGYRIEEICLVPNEKLKQTSYTQPAIFTVSVLAWMSFEEEWNHPHVDFFLGHSLGEYSALCAAGAFGFRTGLELVRQRGALMAEAKNGAMAAVTGLPQETVEEILAGSGRAVSICNYNSEDQVVIGGRQENIEALQAAFSSLPGCTYQQLPVSGAFHSPFMSAAAQAFGTFLEGFEFSEPAVPVLANWNAEPYTRANLKDNLVAQVERPVLWKQSMEKLVLAGETVFFEAGPRNILSKLNTSRPAELDRKRV